MNHWIDIRKPSRNNVFVIGKDELTKRPVVISASSLRIYNLMFRE